jgi:iron complex outermembrane receptor protein
MHPSIDRRRQGVMRARLLATSILASGTLILTAGTAPAQPAATELPPVPVEVVTPDTGLTAPLSGTTLNEAELSAKRSGVSDTAKLLKDVPGVALQSGGGVSSLPIIHGMADDRVNTVVNGMPIISACPNHMNPALSYIDPDKVGKISVYAGIAPVSAGGDNIGGTIEVDSPSPEFAASNDLLRIAGQFSTFYKSTSRGISTSGEMSVANTNLSLGYAGSYSHANDYHRGGDNRPVRTSKYETTDHAVTLAAKGASDVVTLRGGVQYMPYQGFPNQRMDLTDNRSKFVNGRWDGTFDWGKLDTRVYYQDVQHQMEHLDQIKSKTSMPMSTTSVGYGYSVKAEMPQSQRDTFRLGNEFHRYTLDDWWPPSFMSPTGMGPHDFQNIHDGERNRLGTFAEWEAKWDAKWSTLFGIRNDTVWMDTGDIQGYGGSAYNADTASFNSMDHARTDVNIDLTALLRYEHDKASTYEGGYARKTRSPSLYERYAWSTGGMASNMNNWTGDGDGYVGNINLSPEVAHTVSVTGDWHDPARKTWSFKVTPYYTYIQDYIDADRYANSATGETTDRDFVKLKLNNHEAQIYGADVSGNVEAWDAAGLLGRGVFKAVVGWANGQNLDTGDNLYNIMPLNFRFALEHQTGGWKNAVELEGADSKNGVSNARNEIKTPAYALINLRTSYEWQNITATAGIDNLFNHLYHQPLGGVEYGEDLKWGSNVSGPGRSYMGGVTVKF